VSYLYPLFLKLPLNFIIENILKFTKQTPALSLTCLLGDIIWQTLPVTSLLWVYLHNKLQARQHLKYSRTCWKHLFML